VPEVADQLAAGEDVVAGAADVEHRAGCDPEELLRFAFVGVEADVLLDREPLLPHVGDRRAGGRLARGERRDAVEVRDRADELIHEEPVVVELQAGHCSYSS